MLTLLPQLAHNILYYSLSTQCLLVLNQWRWICHYWIVKCQMDSIKSITRLPLNVPTQTRFAWSSVLLLFGRLCYDDLCWSWQTWVYCLIITELTTVIARLLLLVVLLTREWRAWEVTQLTARWNLSWSSDCRLLDDCVFSY